MRRTKAPFTELELLHALNACRTYRQLIHYRTAYRAIYRQLPSETHLSISSVFFWKFKHFTQSINP